MREYFFGRYFKCCSETGTVAVIPAYHRAGGKAGCSIQIITDAGAWNAGFPFDSYKKGKDGFSVEIGANRFGADGMKLDIDAAGLHVEGEVSFGAFTPLEYDIMGPFRFVPFMECRHSVASMLHSVNGEITVNGERYVFDDADGYIEGDRGYSFPREYAWTQCFFNGGSLMLSVARIPFGPFCFTGIIGVVRLGEKEYRIATYKGAKPVKIGNGEVEIRQKDVEFSARLIEKKPHPLYAPAGGAMTRTIRESASCRAAYKLTVGGDTLLDTESERASFEYEYPN